MKSDKDKPAEPNSEANLSANNDDEATQVEVKVVDGIQDKPDDESAGDSAVIEKSEEAAKDADTPDAKAEEVPKESKSERYLRLAAEFDNYKKRTAREFGEIIKGANARLLQELIEIKDNFERALEGESTRGDIEAYRKGVELIYSQLTALLEKENVKPIKAVGQPFNPNLHEAMLQQESEEYDEGIICQEMQKGYQLNGKVLRHARVIVSSGKKRADADQESK